MLASTTFADYAVELLHGKMASAEKQQVMDRFRAGETQVLVATTVIEVGVDVPNATVMIVEDADRFGLAQLHQLRGRVGRGEKPGEVFLVSASASEAALARLSAMETDRRRLRTGGFRPVASPRGRHPGQPAVRRLGPEGGERRARRGHHRGGARRRARHPGGGPQLGGARAPTARSRDAYRVLGRERADGRLTCASSRESSRASAAGAEGAEHAPHHRPCARVAHERARERAGGFDGAVVLDAFAGSGGALGLEALSRGAEVAHFFEKDGAACARSPPTWRRWACPTLGPRARARLHRADVLEKPPAWVRPPFDLVLLRSALRASRRARARLGGGARRGGRACRGGHRVLRARRGRETPRRTPPRPHADCPLRRARKYGDTVVDLLKPSCGAAAATPMPEEE